MAQKNENYKPKLNSMLVLDRKQATQYSKEKGRRVARKGIAIFGKTQIPITLVNKSTGETFQSKKNIYFCRKTSKK